MFKKTLLSISLSIFSLSAFSAESADILSFMITNDGLNRGEIKIRQRAELKSPYLIIGCNNKSNDFDVLIGGLNKKDFDKGQYSVSYTFKNKTYKESFLPAYKYDSFYLMKKTNKQKDNQLFVYNYLLENKVILDFGNNTVFYFNAKDNNKLVDNMNIIVSHCDMKFD